MISWVALNMVEGLKPLHRAALLRAFGSAENVFRMSELELSSVPEIKPELGYRILHFDFREAEAEIARAERSATRIVSWPEQSYPPLLKSIPDPPLVLYIKGEWDTAVPHVALVGSRKPTPYGLNAANLLATDLSRVGITIVSGLARGIDAGAHNAALAAGGQTVAVLGSGLDVIYPSEHKNLAGKIAQQGAIVSEFPLLTQPNRENFPIRNRIISGLSHAIVVVEASAKSGSLITARMAMEQGREVLAVPGSIFSELSQGPHSLIKDGAALVQSWKDIVAELPEEASLRILKESEESSSEEDASLTETEKSVVSLLSFEQPKHVDQISIQTGIQSQELLGALVSLELKSYITQMPGKHFIRVK
jgi:DNA processing protein